MENGLEYLTDLLEDQKKIKKKRIIVSLLSTLLGLSSLAMAFVWYGWKLALVMFLFQYSSNIDNSLKFKK